MKRWFRLSIALLVLIPIALQPVAAQDENTIAAAVLAATQDDTPEFTLLLNALLAADPALTEALSDPDATLTVFAPTDAAFESFLADLGSDEDELFDNVALLNDLLRYHVLPQARSAADLAAQVNAFVPTLLEGDGLAISQADNRLLVNGTPLAQADLVVSNGVIHIIDAVLVPDGTDEALDTPASDAPTTIAQVVLAAAAAEAPEFRVLLLALSQAEPALLQRLIDPAQRFTLFAPTDAAFERALRDLGLSSADLFRDTALLTRILQYHLLPGSQSAAMLAEADALTTVSGETIQADVRENQIVLNDTARVLTADVEASNGVIHIIDALLLPPTDDASDEAEDDTATRSTLAETLATLDQPAEARFDRLLTALERADLRLALADETSLFTVFAPTDAAFEAAGITGEEAQDVLKAVLSNHIIEGILLSDDLVDTPTLTTRGGGTLHLLVMNNGLRLNDTATIIRTDVMASNGVIHIIDALLLPEATD